MWKRLSEFFLIGHFALIFSLSILCMIFFIRTRDRLVLRLLVILIALFVHAFAGLFYYIFVEELGSLFGTINSAISLFLLVLTSLTVPLIIYGVCSSMLSLLELPERQRGTGHRIITACSLVIFLFGLYFIVFLNGNDWLVGLSRALNELFLYGSLFLMLPAVTAAAFLRRTVDRNKKRLLRGIIISFMPIAVFAVIDLLFFLSSAYKLVYLSYFIFSILVYLYTARHYVYRYDPENAALPESGQAFYNAVNISGREQELIPYLIEGRSNKEISEALYISPNTVKTHVRNIYRKAGVSNRLQLLSKIRSHPEG